MKGQYVDYPCLAAYGGPVDPNTILGGFEGGFLPQNVTSMILAAFLTLCVLSFWGFSFCNQSSCLPFECVYTGNEYDMATTMLITFIVNNHVNDEDNARAEAWEAVFVDLLKNYSSMYFNFSFSSEVIV